MDKDMQCQRLEQLLRFLPEPIAAVLNGMDDKTKEATQEIRLRAGRPLSLTIRGSQFFVRPQGTCMLPREDCIMVTAKEVEDCFFALCHHSVYSHHEELKEGYLMLEGGHRAGVCGTVTFKEGRIETVRDISSLNIRVAKEVPQVADELIKQFIGGGVLICGGPGSGKTTLLRDVARQLAGGAAGRCLKVAVIDSRGEIAAVTHGVPMADLGSTADVITACPKAKGIEMALRTLCPDVIVFDELGDLEEVAAVEQSFHAGVTVIATAHAGSLEDLHRRPQIRRLLENDTIRQVVFCQNRNRFSYSIHSKEEIKSNKKEVVLL